MERIGKSKATLIEKKSRWGIYVWKTAEGFPLVDDEGRVLSIASMKGDPDKISQIRSAAEWYGSYFGEPMFVSGVTKISDEEYLAQKQRLSDGLIASPNDIGAWMDFEKSVKAYGRDVVDNG